MSLSIEYITCPAGDYTVLLVNGSVDYEGHSIPDFHWIGLLESFGFKVRQTEISNKQMEERNYFNE